MSRRLWRSPLPPLTWSPHPRVRGVGKFRVEAQSPLLANSEQHVYGGKSHPALHPLPTPVQGWVASAAMPEGVSCLRQLYERGAFYFLGAFLFCPAACSGLPLPPLRGPPTPSARVGKFRVEMRSPLLANSEQHVYGGKSHPALHPLPTPAQG